MTALMLASRAGHHHVVDRLIQAGASVDRKLGTVRTLHSSYHERYDGEESRYKQED